MGMKSGLLTVVLGLALALQAGCGGDEKADGSKPKADGGGSPAGPVTPSGGAGQAEAARFATEAEAKDFFASNETVKLVLGQPVTVTMYRKPTREEARKKAEEEGMPADMVERHLDALMAAPPAYRLDGPTPDKAATGILKLRDGKPVEATMMMFESAGRPLSKWNLLTGQKE